MNIPEYICMCVCVRVCAYELRRKHYVTGLENLKSRMHTHTFKHELKK